LKSSAPEELIEAIRTVEQGLLFFTASLKSFVLTASLSQMYGRPRFCGNELTDREHVVLEMAAQGENSRMIAARLSISPRTVESHRGSLLKKLGLKTQTDLVRYAIRNKIIDG
jgi:DNA-binding NarL/FixJ family response regulator